MTAKTTIDRVGRVVIPKPMREVLDLGPGDTLELEASGQSITLRPMRATVPLTKEKGVWVFRSGQPIAASVVEDVLDKVRSERDRWQYRG